MRYMHLLACVLMLELVAACGGSPAGPQSERNDYGHSVAEMQAAPASAVAASGPVTLSALGYETSSFIPGTPKWNVDPRTGRLDFEQGDATYYPNWFVGVALKDAGGQTAASEWTVATVWVLKGSEFVSSRTLFTQDGKLFVVSYPNPPFSSENTKAVVELTHGQQTQLISAAIVWPR